MKKINLIFIGVVIIVFITILAFISNKEKNANTIEKVNGELWAYKESELWITKSNGQKIYGKLLLPETNAEEKPIVICAHGFGGTYRDTEDYARYIAENGYATYMFDFCGGSNSTKSDGKTTDMSPITEKEDMIEIVNYFKEQNYIDTENIFLLGGSQGGFVSALTAAKMKDDIKGLILLYPALCIPDYGKEEFNYNINNAKNFSLWGVKLGARYYTDVWDMDVYEEIKKFDKNVLIFHGTRDDIVNISYSQKAKEEYASAELITYQGAGHRFYGDTVKKSAEKAVEFLNDNYSKNV